MAANKKAARKKAAAKKAPKKKAAAKKPARRPKGGPPKGNQFWRMRSSHGRAPIFKSPQKLWEACCEYFDWVEANPLWETQYKQAHGEPVQVQVPKMRAMTIAGLCIFLDISETCWKEYRKRDDFKPVTTRVEQIIYTYKFSGAAADLLNPNIIARDLGLRDSKEVTGKEGGPVEHVHKVERSIVRPRHSDS